MSEYVIAKGGVVVKAGIPTLEDAVGLAERITPAKVYKLIMDLRRPWPSAPITARYQDPEILTMGNASPSTYVSTSNPSVAARRPPGGVGPNEYVGAIAPPETAASVWEALQPPKLTPEQEAALEDEAQSLMDRVDAIIARVRKSRGPLPPAVEP